MRNGKVQKNSRRKRALSMLEAQYDKFRNAHEDKPSWTTNGGKRIHKSRTYEQECKRFVEQIEILKSKLRLI